ncbi:MAG: amidase [Roseimicrobium sp.]
MSLYRTAPALLLTLLVSACVSSSHPNRDRAFIKYWPPAEGSTGPRLAVKDLIDMKGCVTSAGSEYLAKHRAPATEDAECLRIVRERHIHIIGKTNLTEFAITASGNNRYFGTPRNRWDGKSDYIPGGSSSGSAVAVATNRADIAFGTDTGGSIRVPAACCGIFGLKTTFGLIPTKGVFPISPKRLDTVGPMARDIPRLVQGMDLLQRGFAAKYAEAVADYPSARRIRIGRLYLSGTDPAIDRAIDAELHAKHFQIIVLDDAFKAKWAQAQDDGTTIALSDAWVNDQQYADKAGVSNITKLVIGQGGRDFASGYPAAVKRKAAWQRDLRRVFRKVDFIAVSTMQNLPPQMPFWGSSVLFEWLVFHSQNTVGINFSGNPALAIPVALPPRGKVIPMTSLQLVGRPLSEAALLNAGRLLSHDP